jgi:hypothetical protein
MNTMETEAESPFVIPREVMHVLEASQGFQLLRGCLENLEGSGYVLLPFYYYYYYYYS